MKRWKMGRKESRRDFARKSGTHPKNNMPTASPSMRGGIRL